MIKIPTMFVRDEARPGHPVTDVVKPECQWVLDGEGIATKKIDGTNVKIEGGQLFKRQKPKNGDYDEASYVPCARTNPADRWAFDAFDLEEDPRDGVYELVGPKIQGNPEGYAGHCLIAVVPPDAKRLVLKGPDARTFDGIREYLERTVMEGLVFHHPDGRLAKIKRRDYGLPWPVK